MPQQQTLQERPRKRRLGTVDDVAQELSLSTRQIYRLSEAGKMPPPMKIGGSNRWDMDAISQWISSRCPRIQEGTSNA